MCNIWWKGTTSSYYGLYLSIKSCCSFKGCWNLETYRHQGTLVGDHPHVFPPSDHAVKSSDRNDVFPDFDTGGTTGSQWIRGKASKRLFRDTSNLSTSVEKSSLRQLDSSYQSQESELPNDLSMVSDLKARLSIGGGKQ